MTILDTYIAGLAGGFAGAYAGQPFDIAQVSFKMCEEKFFIRK